MQPFKYTSRGLRRRGEKRGQALPIAEAGAQVDPAAGAGDEERVWPLQAAQSPR